MSENIWPTNGIKVMIFKTLFSNKGFWLLKLIFWERYKSKSWFFVGIFFQILWQSQKTSISSLTCSSLFTVRGQNLRIWPLTFNAKENLTKYNFAFNLSMSFQLYNCNYAIKRSANWRRVGWSYELNWRRHRQIYIFQVL